ncbi:aminotransferase class I/II-fold pyridoxal phosphate-dependent enzyme [Oscillospiraceae bacterium MB08-C2-2]|nr:aminotransferase class I/II-fold pyridoxal phosphate-dependent enzyme [Oscillospiraceae bacterium MB08-C2-2]
MALYQEMTKEQLSKLLVNLEAEYTSYKAKNLKLDMSRGKPGADQMDLSADLLCAVPTSAEARAADGTDCRNYGVLDGIPEAKALMAPLMDVGLDEVLVGGTSSLNLMFDCVARAMTHGVVGSLRPWCKEEGLKFLCPSPGYDRHFAVTQHFGFELISIPMTPQGPDMDLVEKLVASDEKIKGIWCVPKYSNPQGITYSDDTVRRLANLSPAAPDFRIFWDNAYSVHDLYPENPDILLPLLPELKKNGKENMAFLFCSTAKITFAGEGLAALGASKENLAQIKASMAFQLIGHDKLNQLRHVRFLKDMDGIRAQMARHAEIIRPKFELVLSTLKKELGGTGLGSWIEPKGGYFIALDVMEGCAKHVVALCKEAGVVMTGAGASSPYGVDPMDTTIRIAPTFPTLEELGQAANLLCLCVKIACVQKLLAA